MSPKSLSISAIKAIELKAAQDPSIVSLAQGIPSFATPREIKEFTIQKINEGLCDKYSLTNGIAELREEISKYLETQEGLLYSADKEILVTAGSIQGISAALCALCSPGDEVILPSPSYTSYQAAVSLARCTPTFVPLDEDKNFDLDINKIERAITSKTKAIIYCNPNNPTGTVYSEEATYALCEIAERHNIYIITDEVYKEFYYINTPHCSPALVQRIRDLVVRVYSFSKAYAMTGWRVGFLHTTERNMKKIMGAHDAMVTCAPVASQYAALAALKISQDTIESFRTEFAYRRNLTIGYLDQIADLVDYQVPQASYFVFPRIKGIVPNAHNSTLLADKILTEAKVALVPGAAFGPTGESHLRICFGRSREDLNIGLQRFCEYLSSSTRVKREAKRKEEALEPSSIEQRHKQKRGLKKQIKEYTTTSFAKMARQYIQKNNIKVIGIAGGRGKTVTKRVVHSLLSLHHPAQMGLLSYNTKTGFPFGALGIAPPKSVKETLALALQMPNKLFLSEPTNDFLVIEYGIRSLEDAKELAQIYIPDWLITCSINHEDENERADSHRGITWLSSKTGAQRTIWNESNVKESFNEETKILTSASAQTYPVRISAPSDSVKEALVIAVNFAERIEIPEKKIRAFLAGQIESTRPYLTLEKTIQTIQESDEEKGRFAK